MKLRCRHNGRCKLRVAHVTQGLDLGGSEKLLVEFARHADRQRFELLFISLGDRGVLTKDVESLGWPVMPLNVPSGLRPELVLRLARWLRCQRIDVVHTHDDRQLLYGALAARLARVPRVIHTRHGRSLGLSPRQQRLVALAARRIHRFVCVSRDAARLSARQGIPRQKLCIIWNGIDLDRFSFTGLHPDGPAVLVARLSPEKDIGTLIEAARLMVRREPSFRLEIAGDGTCLTELQDWTRRLGLEDRVRFLGATHFVHGVLSRARLFVLSSISEGVSLTLLEAMATGLPVVATDVGGNPEVVSHGETGLLVAPRDPAALARAIWRVWSDRNLGRELGAAGRRRVEKHFEVRRMVAQYEKLYEGGGSAVADSRQPSAVSC